MERRLCYISRNYRAMDKAGNKAKTDNEETFREMGAVNLGLPRTEYNNKVVTFFLDLIGVVRSCVMVRRDDVILLQYPVKKYFSFICRMAHLRGAKTVALIHDLGSMRRKKLTVKHEISRLMNADAVIASNDIMKGWLRDNGFTKPLGSLGLFDYRSKSRHSRVESRESRVESQVSPNTKPLTPNPRPILIYAGALNTRKNTFLLKIGDIISSYDLQIYGNRDGLPGLNDSEHVKVYGFMAAEDFIANIEGDFGLVWDGDSLDTCSGNFGEYLRWNSPHKVSFYLRAGLPVVVWSQAAVAPIIKREGIGLCIDSLSELDEVINSITPEQMRQMRENVMNVSDRLCSGQFFKEAFGQIENKI